MVFASSDAGPWWGGSVQVLCRRRGLLPALAAFLLGASLLLEGIPDVIGHTPVVGGGGDAVGLGVLLDFLLVGFQPGLGWRGRCRSAVRGWRLSVQSFRRSGGRGIVPVLGELPDVVNASDHGWGSGALGRLRRGRVVEARSALWRVLVRCGELLSPPGQWCAGCRSDRGGVGGLCSGWQASFDLGLEDGALGAERGPLRSRCRSWALHRVSSAVP